MIGVIGLIAKREGIGTLLAEGVKRASEKLGKGSEYFAMHIKGLELPGYDICDLCEGDPKCVEYCPKKALIYATREEASQQITKYLI